MMFTSKALPKYLPDHFDGDGCMFGDWQPHFTPGQRNEPNPVLAEFREESEMLSAMYPKDWLRVCAKEFWGDGATKDHLDHATKVLTRLATLTEGVSA